MLEFHKYDIKLHILSRKVFIISVIADLFKSFISILEDVDKIKGNFENNKDQSESEQ